LSRMLFFYLFLGVSAVVLPKEGMVRGGLNPTYSLLPPLLPRKMSLDFYKKRFSPPATFFESADGEAPGSTPTLPPQSVRLPKKLFFSLSPGVQILISFSYEAVFFGTMYPPRLMSICLLFPSKSKSVQILARERCSAEERD